MGKLKKENNFKSLEKKKMDMSQLRKFKGEDKKMENCDARKEGKGKLTKARDMLKGGKWKSVKGKGRS